MADLMRVHDFSTMTGQPIVGEHIDSEFDQLVARINDIEPDSLKASLAEALGVSQTGSVRRGSSIVATEESRSDTAYGLMPTPDRVQDVVLPSDGLIVVAYRAVVRSSVAGAGAAAIFVGGSQLEGPRGAGGEVADEATGWSDSAGTYGAIGTGDGGLEVLANGNITYSGGTYSGNPILLRSVAIEAAAGTYDVSVRYKASSGSVDARDRKLLVWTVGF